MKDPLPSWNQRAARNAIVDLVTRVTREGGPDFVPPADRVATFDNDGTLWCEQPLQVQVFFMMDEVGRLVAKDPSLRERQPYKALLERDIKTLVGLGRKGLEELFFATHTGMTEEEFAGIASQWFTAARHPKFDRLFSQVTYLPQRELLDYLRANDFRTFIVSGGGVDFMRVISEQAYGIYREQVIGSSAKLEFEVQGDRAVVMKLPELNSFDDREVKAANIALHIGRRPVLAFGNSDGDLAMLRYCRTGPGPRLALLLHHDDSVREVAYDRDFKLSALSEGLDKATEYGITLVSMKDDWKAVFGPVG
ncbi:MAG: hypothetical protein RL030_950 [Pseudomonadota bacterium]